MRTLLVTLSVAALCASSAAHATSSHQVTKVAPIKKDGKTVGAAFTVLLKPDQPSTVEVALGHANKNGNAHTPQTYMHVRDASLGYMASEVETVSAQAPTQKVLQVIYGKGNSLKAGDSVEVYSFWNKAHLWGSNRHVSIKEPTYTLPGN